MTTFLLKKISRLWRIFCQQKIMWWHFYQRIIIINKTICFRSSHLRGNAHPETRHELDARLLCHEVLVLSADDQLQHGKVVPPWAGLHEQGLCQAAVNLVASLQCRYRQHLKLPDRTRWSFNKREWHRIHLQYDVKGKHTQGGFENWLVWKSFFIIYISFIQKKYF